MSPTWGVVASNAAVAAALAAVALGLGRAGRNAAALHLLWVAALLKLFAPPLVVAGLPIAPTTAAPAIEAGSRAAPGSSDPNPHRASGPPGRAGAPSPPAPGTAGDSGPTRRDPPTGRAYRGAWPLDALLGAVWLAGVVGVGAMHATRIARFRAALGDTRPAPADVRATVARLAGRLGLRHVPEVRVTPRTLPPLVWSPGGRPQVVLPAALLDRLGPEAREAIVAHELAHVRRGDHLVRLLEVAATAIFWWHPVAWLAGRHLRDLEEECVDARVVALLGRPRAYAAALVDTLEFLAGRDVPPAPLRTANDPTRSLTRRLQMLARPRPSRLDARGLALLAALLALPLAVAFAAQEPKAPAATPPAVLRGRVTDEAGKPIADARVLVAAPAVEMRQLDAAARARLRETRTRADGSYRIELPGVVEKTKASIDVLKPGFRRLSGTLMQGGDPNTVEVEPGREAELAAQLHPARYLRGTVVDEQGRPIPSSTVFAAFAFADGGSGGVEMTSSAADGTFEVFNYRDEDHAFRGTPGRGLLHFAEPGHIGTVLDEVDAIEPGRREAIRVVLDSGRKVAGTVLDADGRPVANALVDATRRDGSHRKGTRTDAAGAFLLRGLEPGLTTVTARAAEIQQLASLPIGLNADKEGVEVRLRPMALPADLKRYDVLGMQLADLTPELKAAYGVRQDRGVMVLDPKLKPGRLMYGELAVGDNFWQVGDDRAPADVREFVAAVLAEAAGQTGDARRVRVVFDFRNTEAVGNMTSYLKLTADDVRELQALADRLAGPER